MSFSALSIAPEPVLFRASFTGSTPLVYLGTFNQSSSFISERFAPTAKYLASHPNTVHEFLILEPVAPNSPIVAFVTM